MKNCVTDFILSVSLYVCTVAALNTSKPFQPSQGKTTLSCLAFQEVLKADGAYDTVSWSICSSRNCDGQQATWTWVAGMNGTGETKVGRDGINVTSTGALVIQNVRLSDAGKYMCKVKPINYRSPQVYFTTLVVIEDATGQRKAKTINKPHEKDCKEGHSDDSKNPVCASTVLSYVLPVLLALAVGYILYLKRSDLCCRKQRNSVVRENVSGADVV